MTAPLRPGASGDSFRRMKIALTIAGSDSSGGAGIQADLKTFHAFGVFGTSALTAITAQNTVGVTAIHVLPTDIVRQQIQATADDLPPSAVKTGMLATSELVSVVSEAIRVHHFANFVLDPVMVATSGDSLLDRAAEAEIAERLVPLADLVTPNLAEAAILVGSPVQTVAEMEAAARGLVRMGARAALVKGGHLPGDVVVDVLYDGETLQHWERLRLATTNTHGTGCTLSAAITAGLAIGRPLRTAVNDALEYVRRAMQTAPGLGRGHGPLNHFVPAQRGAGAESFGAASRRTHQRGALTRAPRMSICTPCSRSRTIYKSGYSQRNAQGCSSRMIR
jgi:hydroxymethylpyrimidine/phosphomethylpyrimidine kinase